MSKESMHEFQVPLTGLRVLDLTDGRGEMCARYLADLGADVIYVEPPGGALARKKEPVLDGVSLYFATHNANKRSVVIDLQDDEGKECLLGLAATADILVESGDPGALGELGLTPELLKDKFPHLVVLSITEFGQTGPYRDYQGTNSVHMAMAGMLARSGLKGRYPLMPPGSNLAYEASSIQAAWVALVAYWYRLQQGSGGYLDFSIFEATTQILDPGLGVTGSAAAGKSAKDLVPRGRPPSGKAYPIFPCADGYVRICVLNPRQWQGMSAWLGDDHPFTDPSFASMSKRFPAMRDINVLIADLFKDMKGSELVKEGLKRGVPIATVSSPTQVLEDEHFNTRDTFTTLKVASGIEGKVPAGFVEIDGKFCGIHESAPEAGQHTDQVLKEWQSSNRASSEEAMQKKQGRPFEGLRVLDLGVIVAGAELGRLFADQGAEVIKIENLKYVDGLRQSLNNEPMTESFAQGNRGKYSFGLNLRSDKGKEIFKQLVAISDIVLSNFKPGTMESLGFDYETLKAVNPRIIVSDSSALGSSGPMSKSMGYGPLVRASVGLVGLWRYPDDAESFSDAVTIIPDHFAARASACAILALLIRRLKTGEGGTVSLSQADAMLAAMSDDFLLESLQPGSIKPRGNHSIYDAPNNVFSCAGDDEWCVVAVRNNDEWRKLCELIGRSDIISDERYANAESRLSHREELEQIVADWTSQRSPGEVTEQLQNAGVPAGYMQRLDEYEHNPHYIARQFFRSINQPGLDKPLFTENAPVGVSHLPDLEFRPAPLLVEHTEELANKLLGFSESQIEALVSSGDLELMKKV